MITEYLLDTETTGLESHHTILEICIIKRVDFQEVDRLYMKIKPTSADLLVAHPRALKINGYTEEAWEDAISPYKAAKEIVNFIRPNKHAVLIAHNAQFDIGMVTEFCRRHSQKIRIPYKVIDTSPIAMVMLWSKGLRSGKMDHIRDLMGWSAEGSHSAEKDTEDLMKLWDLLRK